nr:hypothetical protein [Nanoarchaeum sp.]
MNGPNFILDVGCGSGLLSLELAEKTDAVIYGIDISEDMIELANMNRDKRAKENLPKRHVANDPSLEILDVAEYNKTRLRFDVRSVYDLSTIVKKGVDFVICRNALHRFRNPQNAIDQMYSTLGTGGKIYIRDLKRDANWRTVLERIGEKRWSSPSLVIDYIGAMASMLTTPELEKIFLDLQIPNFTISDGSYLSTTEETNSNNIQEFASEVEYTCVIEK